MEDSSATSDGVSGGTVRTLGPRDLDAATRVLAKHGPENVFIDYRARLTQMEPRWLGGRILGYFCSGELRSLLHVGANVVPAEVDDAAAAAFAQHCRQLPHRALTVVGPQHQVAAMWAHVSATWPQPRIERWEQEHLVMAKAPPIAGDPRVRRTRPEEFEVLYPAAVAMYTEEVGSSPEADGGREPYRARVRQLIGRGWSFSRIENGEVVFKAEVACATPHACQIQGVYVAPQFRGQGLAAAAMATVVQVCLEQVAPRVALYVNAHNEAARRAYRRAGFLRTETFATLMF